MIICRDKTNLTLRPLMADIETNQHRVLWDIGTKFHSPQVTTKLDIDLSKNISKDSFFPLLNNMALHKLRKNRALGVDKGLHRLVKILWSSTWNDYQIEKLILTSAFLSLYFLLSFGLILYFIIFVVLGYCLLEVINSILSKRNNFSIIHSYAQTWFACKVVEGILYLVSTFLIEFRTEDDPFS